MRSPAVLPKSVLLVEIIGIVLLALAWLSLNQYLRLPAPFSSPTAALLMIFLGILLMLPAAIALMWRMAKIVAPQLTQTKKTPSSPPDREQRDDADH
ncbi:TPA: YbjC family protein [Raoultella planticola]